MRLVFQEHYISTVCSFTEKKALSRLFFMEFRKTFQNSYSLEKACSATFVLTYFLDYHEKYAKNGPLPVNLFLLNKRTYRLIKWKCVIHKKVSFLLFYPWQRLYAPLMIIFWMLTKDTRTTFTSGGVYFLSNLYSISTKEINPLMHNILKWSDARWKSCSICCKILKVCLTIFGYCTWKG